MIQSSPHEIDCGPNGLAIRRSQDEDAVLEEQFIKSIKELEAGLKLMTPAANKGDLAAPYCKRRA